MKAEPTLWQWIKSWFRLQGQGPRRWYRYHDAQAREWLAENERIQRAAEADRARREGRS